MSILFKLIWTFNVIQKQVKHNFSGGRKINSEGFMEKPQAKIYKQF